MPQCWARGCSNTGHPTPTPPFRRSLKLLRKVASNCGSCFLERPCTAPKRCPSLQEGVSSASRPCVVTLRSHSHHRSCNTEQLHRATRPFKKGQVAFWSVPGHSKKQPRKLLLGTTKGTPKGCPPLLGGVGSLSSYARLWGGGARVALAVGTHPWKCAPRCQSPPTRIPPGCVHSIHSQHGCLKFSQIISF